MSPAVVTEGLRQRLPASYSQRAMFLKTAVTAVAWYTPTDDSRVFAQEKIRDFTESPVAFARDGHGNLGYVGDVHSENESHEVVLAMCGLAG